MIQLQGFRFRSIVRILEELCKGAKSVYILRKDRKTETNLNRFIFKRWFLKIWMSGDLVKIKQKFEYCKT